MKSYNHNINIVFEIMGFVGMIIGYICEKRYLIYISGFISFFFSTCLYLDYVQRVQSELGIFKLIKIEKETNQYGYKWIVIFIVGCCLSALFCKLNVNFVFLILLGVLLGIIMRFDFLHIFRH